MRLKPKPRIALLAAARVTPVVLGESENLFQVRLAITAEDFIS